MPGCAAEGRGGPAGGSEPPAAPRYKRWTFAGFGQVHRGGAKRWLADVSAAPFESLQAMVRRAPRDRFNVFLGFCAPGSEGVRQGSAGAEFTESLDERGGRRRTACAEAEATGPTRKRKA